MTLPDPLSHLPHPGDKRIALHVSTPAERALRQGHPWLFEQAIRQQSHAGQPGDLAVIFDKKNKFLAIGLYDPGDSIRVRILHQGQPVRIDAEWFKTKLAGAVQLRAPLAAQPTDRATTGYRLVNGENDGLPGLVVDRYASTLVCKLYTPAWIPHLQEISSGLIDILLPTSLVLRFSRTLSEQTDLLYGLQDGMVIAGQLPAGPILFLENGLTFEADPLQGQKTGFFLDQRDNRSRVEDLSNGKSVLNLFAYTGGFSVYAGHGGAREVVSVDLSAPAMEAAARNWTHNSHFPSVAAAVHQTVTADAFEYLAQSQAQQRTFDLLVIDPPMFAQNQSQVDKALAAYRQLTTMGLEVLRSGGVLVQASCSSRIEAEVFFNTVHQAASKAGRPLQELERTGQLQRRHLPEMLVCPGSLIFSIFPLHLSTEHCAC